MVTVVRVSADEPVVTVLTDFEDDTTAASISEVHNVLAADCAAHMIPIPARGQRSLGLEIGATTRDVSAACDLRFRAATRFDQADRVATYCWLKEGQIGLAFRIRDVHGRIFETPTQIVAQRYRWVRVAAGLEPRTLKLVGNGQPVAEHTTATPARPPVAWPVEVLGYRVSTQRVGRQVVYLDELQVEHRVSPNGMIRGEFRFDKPTKIYRPGSTVGAAVVLENRSRMRAVYVSVRLAWTGPDGSVINTQYASAKLPAGGEDYRSYKAIDFSQPVDHPGLYQLVARVSAIGWRADKVFKATIAVTPDNLNLPRGRSAFFGIRTDPVPEPLTDQMLEIDLARQIGAHLLAIEMPWRLIEPRAGDYDFAVLDPLIDAITNKGMAPMIVVTEPPQWLEPGSASGTRRLRSLLRACAGHYGRKVAFYQCTLSVMGLASPLEQNDLIVELQKHVAGVQPDARVLSAPYPVPPSDRAADTPPPPSGPQGPYLAFQTSGDSAAALGDLQAFAKRHGFTWRSWHWWFHSGEPLPDTGTDHEAVAVLRHYVEAATAGVAGVIWSDLRDRSALPSRLDDMRGLARRSFCPKSPLLGYATAVGMLTGLRYAGPVHGAADVFDSALFAGSDRQVAVLLPKPNRIRPAVVAPIRGVAGELKVYDFERRPLKLLGSGVPALVSTLTRPFFITLDLESAQPEPQLALARPWLSVPAPVFCVEGTSFTLEITAPFTLGSRSFLQLLPPTDAPFDTSFSARGLAAEAGETLRYDVQLTPRGGRSFDTATLDVSVSLEGRRVSAPLEVRPLAEVQPLSGDSNVTGANHSIGQVATAAPDEASAAVTLYAGYQPRRLYLTIALTDDRFVGADVLPADQPRSGDELLLGLAAEKADEHVEVQVAGLPAAPRLEPVHGTTPTALRGWRCQVRTDERTATRNYHVEVPARSLGASRFEVGMRLLLAVRYADDDGGVRERTEFAWGSGLDGSRSTAEFRWVRLAAGSGE